MHRYLILPIWIITSLFVVSCSVISIDKHLRGIDDYPVPLEVLFFLGVGLYTSRKAFADTALAILEPDNHEEVSQEKLSAYQDFLCRAVELELLDKRSNSYPPD